MGQNKSKPERVEKAEKAKRVEKAEKYEEETKDAEATRLVSEAPGPRADAQPTANTTRGLSSGVSLQDVATEVPTDPPMTKGDGTDLSMAVEEGTVGGRHLAQDTHRDMERASRKDSATGGGATAQTAQSPNSAQECGGQAEAEAVGEAEAFTQRGGGDTETGGSAMSVDEDNTTHTEGPAVAMDSEGAQPVSAAVPQAQAKVEEDKSTSVDFECLTATNLTKSAHRKAPGPANRKPPSRPVRVLLTDHTERAVAAGPGHTTTDVVELLCQRLEYNDPAVVDRAQFGLFEVAPGTDGKHKRRQLMASEHPTELMKDWASVEEGKRPCLMFALTAQTFDPTVPVPPDEPIQKVPEDAPAKAVVTSGRVGISTSVPAGAFRLPPLPAKGTAASKRVGGGGSLPQLSHKSSADRGGGSDSETARPGTPRGGFAPPQGGVALPLFRLKDTSLEADNESTAIRTIKSEPPRAMS